MGQEVKGKIAHQEVGPELPPPGDERRDVLAARQDALEEKAENLADAMEMHKADPAAYQPEHDIQAQLDALEVSNGNHEYYHYVWVQVGGSGRFVINKKRQGYELVSGPMPEAVEVKQADGSRRIGDVILMRIDRERYRKLRQDAEYRRQARELGVSARALELADRYADKGLKVYETNNIPEHILKVIDKREKAQRRGRQMMDQFIRQGNVPGMPAPQAG